MKRPLPLCGIHPRDGVEPNFPDGARRSARKIRSTLPSATADPPKKHWHELRRPSRPIFGRNLYGSHRGARNTTAAAEKRTVASRDSVGHSLTTPGGSFSYGRILVGPSREFVCPSKVERLWTSECREALLEALRSVPRGSRRTGRVARALDGRLSSSSGCVSAAEVRKKRCTDSTRPKYSTRAGT
eukprot:scaffold442_cov268-Pinguiococcus_pyrenoidosus.AAC.29